MLDVFIDVDSTLNDFSEGYYAYYNKIYGTSHKFKKRNLTQYEISKSIPGITEQEAIDARTKIFSTPGFWLDIPIYPNAAKAVKWINNNFRVFILTAPWVDYLDCAKEKYLWIQKNLPFLPINRVILSNNKSVIHRDSILIDDHINNLYSFKGKTIKFNQPYNKQGMANFEAGSWNQVLSIMKKIKRELERSGHINRLLK